MSNRITPASVMLLSVLCLTNIGRADGPEVSSVLGKLPDPAELAAMQEKLAPSRGALPVKITFNAQTLAQLKRDYRHVTFLTEGRVGEAFPLGVTGAYALDFKTRKELMIAHVDAATPASGVLIKGDIVIGVNGRLFAEGRDPRIAMGYSLVEAQTKAMGGVLALQLVRRGRAMNVQVDLGVTETYSPTWPFQCEKSRKIADRIVKLILKYEPAGGTTRAKHGRPSGSWWNTLMLMASGDDAALERARRDAYAYGQPDPLKGGHTWNFGNALIILCEYYLLTGDSAVLPDIIAHKATIERGQTRSGSWCHAMNMGGYGEVNSAGLPCFIGLILARECGVEMNETVFRRSKEFFGSFIGGYVPYGAHPPEQFGRTDNGKNGMAAVAFALLGDKDAASTLARPTAYSYRSREQGHADGLFSFIWGPLGAYHAPRPEFRMFLDNMLWYYELGRRRDGGLHSLRETHWAQPYGNSSGLGLFLMIPRKHLRILGAPQGVFSRRAPTGLEKAAELYRQKKWPELKAMLKTVTANKLTGAEQRAYAADLLAAYERLEKNAAATVTMILANIQRKDLARARVQFDALVKLLGEDRPELAAIRRQLGPTDPKARPSGGNPKIDPNAHWARVKVLATQKGPPAPIIWDNILPAKPTDKTPYRYLELPPDSTAEPGAWRGLTYAETGWKSQADRTKKADRTSRRLFRRTFTLARADYRYLQIASRNKVTVYVNGYLIAVLPGSRKKSEDPWMSLRDAARGVLREGPNVLAVELYGREAPDFALRAGPTKPDVAALAKGLAGYWKFDEGQGKIVKCSVSTKNVAAIQGAGKWVEGKIGSALNLGGEARAEVPGFKDAIGPDGQIEAMTIAFWARVARREGTIVAKAPKSRRAKDGWKVSEGTFEAVDSGGKRIRAGGHGVSEQWRHFVYVVDCKANLATVYVNAGAMSGRNAMKKEVKLNASGIAPSTGPLVIGAGGETLKVIDELAIWGRALSQDEVKMLCNGAAGLELDKKN
jgi:hypothetical protein